MKKVLYRCLLLTSLLTAGAHAATDPWLLVADSPDDNNQILVKMDTLKKTASGVSVLTQGLSRTDPHQNYEVHYAKAYISKADCSNGYGTIVFSSLSNQPLTNVDYVQGGRSLGSRLGENLCGTIKN